MFGFLKRKFFIGTIDHQSPEETFWNWFRDHKQEIEDFIDSVKNDYSIYNELSMKIRRYNNYLFAELTKTEDDQYVMIITPDGMMKGVEATKKLGESSPELENWVIKKFRQPNDEITLNINGLEYPSSDIEVVPELNLKEEKVDIQVFIRNMNEDEKNHQHLAFLYFDHILGEFNTITRVGHIDFYHLEKDQHVKGGLSLLELRALIEKELY